MENGTDIRYANALKMYEGIDSHLKEDVIDALLWARETLRDHEGSGHYFEFSNKNGRVRCSFAKPEWHGDHCGKAMDSSAEAVVMAVCEYLSGC